MTYKAALFDLDGVLIDSESGYTVFWTDVARSYGFEDPAQYALDIKGTALSRILLSYPPADRDGIVEQLHDFESRMAYPLYPGAEQALHELARRGIPCALVTSSDDVKLGYLFDQHPGLRDCFAAIVSGSMVTHSKPHPEGYLKAASLLGVAPAGCVVFEDSLQGLQSGCAAGCRVVAITTTNSPEAVRGLCDTQAPSVAQAVMES